MTISLSRIALTKVRGCRGYPRYGGAALGGVLGLLPVVVVVALGRAAGPALLPVVKPRRSTTLNLFRMLPTERRLA